MSRPNYHRATRNAYRTLLACNIDRLPVDAADLCSRCRNTKVMSFREARCRWDDFEPLWDGPSRTAFTFRQNDANLIFWNDEEMRPGSGLHRFSLAHELAHIVLRHKEDDGCAAELEANVFAQHLLCPRPVLECVDVRGPLELSYLCGVSLAAARIVWAELREGNRYVDTDMWKLIFAAFELDKKRSVADFLSPVAILAADIRRRRYAQSVTG